MTNQVYLQMDRLLALMATLRDPEHGCEWDRAQTFASISPYTIEEAYEVADAIERNDHKSLQDELGDLLLQVVFHARIAEEHGKFNFADVAQSISHKLEMRHPHIFGDNPDDGQQADRWEAIKAAERTQQGATSAVDGVAKALPALMRAEKLQKRAARTGFDWPDHEGPRAKVLEELEELESAETDRDRLDEAGDLLFSAVNVVRAYGVAPEEALRFANAKFERRFRSMENLAALHSQDFVGLTLEQKEAYWQLAKAAEK